MALSPTRVFLTGGGAAISSALALLLVPRPVEAQEALFNAISVNSILATRSNPTNEFLPDQPHLGPVRVSCGFYASTEFDDNINSTQQDPQADVLLHGGLNLGFNWAATERSLLQFAGGIGYVHYAVHSQYGGLEVNPNSAVTWQIGFSDGTVSFYDQLSYAQQVTQEAALANLVTLPRLDNTIGTRVEWEPGHWVVQGSYGHNIFYSPDSNYNYLNRSSEYLFASAAWRFAEKTRVGAEASATFTAYDLAYQSDNWSVSAGAFAEWQITQNLLASLRAGPTIYHFTSAGVAGQPSDLNSYYAAMEISQTLSQFLSHQLSLQRDVSLGINLGSDYVEQFTSTYSISVALTPYVNLSLNATYQQGNQPLLVQVPGFSGVTPTEIENFERVGFGGRVSLGLTDHCSTGIRYAFWKRHSSLPGQSYVANTVGVDINYNF